MNQYTDARSRPGAKEDGLDDRALYDIGLPGSPPQQPTEQQEQPNTTGQTVWVPPPGTIKQ